MIKGNKFSYLGFLINDFSTLSILISFYISIEDLWCIDFALALFKVRTDFPLLSLIILEIAYNIINIYYNSHWLYLAVYLYPLKKKS